ncbi:E3 ubiquitin-protein ligase TRIM71-like [Mytilus trossulus]|uniref:E3 ubiquitin-protein ligase TRIM71-like n=1 Tax=Mytilus trossulus TaxID=6551 RepID=UPI003006B324
MAQVASKTCEIGFSASGSQYCLECEQYVCENCKIFHKRQKLSKNHQFQSSADDIPEAKFKCKDHNEDVSLLCNTCNVVVCSKCVTGNHKGHAFSQLMDSITQLKEKTKKDVRRKVQEATLNMKKIEEGQQAFAMKIEVVVKTITEEGTKIKAMVDKYIEKMITSIKNQSMLEKDKLAKSMAGYNMVLKSGIHLHKKIHELDKKLNEGKLLQSLQLITVRKR